ncbi:MAG TPA: hypothetical protein VFE41_18175 [Acetobacteraceae bacterium]|nr:hypothetical protein [Acetobacteraceae bacterium]
MIVLVIVGAAPVTVPSGLSALNGGWLGNPMRTFFAACSFAKSPWPFSGGAWANALPQADHRAVEARATDPVALNMRRLVRDFIPMLLLLQL